MSEYKRLTEKVFTHDDGSSEYDCDASVRATNNRLGQLEDKIEEGKLVELPCKIGDIVYRVRAYHKKKYEIIERICFSITYRGNNSWEIFSTTDDMLGVSVFLTREAAEARLKELEAKGK